MNILQALSDEKIFAPFFRKRWLRGDSWRAWRSFLAALYALPMDREAREIYVRHTARQDVPAEAVNECFIIAGRRSGKSRVASLIGTYSAAFRTYDLAAGEQGIVMILGPDRRQCRVILNYIHAFFDSIPILRSMVVNKTREGIELSNQIRIEVHTSDYRSVRGFTICAAILDELAFWRDENSVNPARETLNALRPALSTTNGLLLGISSPYAKSGILFEEFRENFGKAGASTLIWKAASREMNPTLSAMTVQAALHRDRASATSEHLAEFRDDLSDYISIEDVEACVLRGVREIPFSLACGYSAFCDPSGGRSDSFALGISHVESGRIVLDCLLEIEAPFSPSEAVATCAEVLKRYHVSEVVGDRYGGSWPAESFEKFRIRYKESERNKSELYLEALPLLTSKRAVLLDNRKLLSQLVNLDRRTARGGRDSIDHRSGSHDDLSNACAGCLVLALEGAGGGLGYVEYLKGISAGTIADPDTLPARKITAVTTPMTAAVTTGEACCGNPLPITIAGGQRRCNSCGRQSWPAGAKPTVVSIGPTRGDVVGRGSKFIIDEFSRSPSMAERLKTLRRFR